MGKSSSLLDEIGRQAANNRRTGPACAVATVLGSLEVDDAEDLRKALAGHYTGSAIGRALRDRGYAVSDYTINRHRRGDCTCGAA